MALRAQGDANGLMVGAGAAAIRRGAKGRRVDAELRGPPLLSERQGTARPVTRAHDALAVGPARVRTACRMEEARHRGAQECGPRALHAGAVREQTRSQSRAVVSRSHAPTKSAAVRSMVEASVTLPRCGNAQVRAKSAPRLTDCGGRSSCNGKTEGHVNRLKFLKRQMYGRAEHQASAAAGIKVKLNDRPA